MGMSRVTYNDYTFPDRSNFQVNEEFRYDDAGMTVIGTVFRLNVQTIICVENVAPGTAYDSPLYDCGSEMHLLRQRLSKPGMPLLIEHDGFGPRIAINSAASPVRDIEWGPKPHTISWEPVGHTRSVEVIWVCEFYVPICDGRTGAPSFRGLAASNYSIAFSFDSRGFTTRRITGYIEIAMTRISQTSRQLPDSADNYRNRIAVKKPANFEREVSWDVSADKRRAMFSIVDKEISSPNAWPPGVVKIQGTHRVGWNRSNLTRISNTISVSIEMSPTELKSRAWLIFKDIVATRHQYAPNITAEQATLMIESLDIVEELYENKVSFQMSYTFLGQVDLEKIFQTTGLFQPLAIKGQPSPTWETWDESIKHLNPLRGEVTNFGVSGLKHDAAYDKIVDLCDNEVLATPPQPPARLPQQAVHAPVLSNTTPRPNGSWLVFDASLRLLGGAGSTIHTIQLGEKDTIDKRFNPAEPTKNGAEVPQLKDKALKAFIEEKGDKEYFVYEGYAERIGYPVPRPGEMKFGGVWMKPVNVKETNVTNKGIFEPPFFAQKFLGMHYGVPKYAASWRVIYVLSRDKAKRQIAMHAQFQGDPKQFEAEGPQQ
jgi:hypothetical protein